MKPKSRPCSLSIHGEASDNAATFTNSNNNISNLPNQCSSGMGAIELNAVGDAGAAQQTSDIAPLYRKL